MAGEDSERGREPGAFCAKKTERARCAGALRIPKQGGVKRAHTLRVFFSYLQYMAQRDDQVSSYL